MGFKDTVYEAISLIELISIREFSVTDTLNKKDKKLDLPNKRVSIPRHYIRHPTVALHVLIYSYYNHRLCKT